MHRVVGANSLFEVLQPSGFREFFGWMRWRFAKGCFICWIGLWACFSNSVVWMCKFWILIFYLGVCLDFHMWRFLNKTWLTHIRVWLRYWKETLWKNLHVEFLHMNCGFAKNSVLLKHFKFAYKMYHIQRTKYI